MGSGGEDDQKDPAKFYAINYSADYLLEDTSFLLFFFLSSSFLFIYNKIIEYVLIFKTIIFWIKM